MQISRKTASRLAAVQVLFQMEYHLNYNDDGGSVTEESNLKLVTKISHMVDSIALYNKDDEDMQFGKITKAFVVAVVMLSLQHRLEIYKKISEAIGSNLDDILNRTSMIVICILQIIIAESLYYKEAKQVPLGTSVAEAILLCQLFDEDNRRAFVQLIINKCCKIKEENLEPKEAEEQ